MYNSQTSVSLLFLQAFLYSVGNTNYQGRQQQRALGECDIWNEYPFALRDWWSHNKLPGLVRDSLNVLSFEKTKYSIVSSKSWNNNTVTVGLLKTKKDDHSTGRRGWRSCLVLKNSESRGGTFEWYEAQNLCYVYVGEAYMGHRYHQVLAFCSLACMARYFRILDRNRMYLLRFEVLTTVTMKNAVFWNVALCRSCMKRRFGGTSGPAAHCSHLLTLVLR
jgi:hypothetical protein